MTEDDFGINLVYEDAGASLYMSVLVCLVRVCVCVSEPSVLG